MIYFPGNIFKINTNIFFSVLGSVIDDGLVTCNLWPCGDHHSHTVLCTSQFDKQLQSDVTTYR